MGPREWIMAKAQFAVLFGERFNRGSCPGAWCRKVFLSSVGCFVQPTSAGMLTMVSSLSGAMVSSVM